MTTTPPQPPQQPPFQPDGGGYAPPPGPPQYQQPQYNQQQPPQAQFPQYGPNDQQGAQYQQPGQQQFQGDPGQQQYAQQQPGQFPQGQQFAQGQLQCRFCGGMPAVEATVRGHQGFLIIMRMLKLQGPFCRTCGVATLRDMSAKSMWQGWWGLISLIANPITLLSNLGTYSKFKHLPEPAPGAPGRPMELGKPLFKRPVVLGLVVPVALIGAIVFVNSRSVSSADVGACVVNKGTPAKPNVKVVDCGSSDAAYKIVGKIDDTANGDACAKFENSTVSYTDERGSSKYTLCLAPNK
ncbi:LppU/SCO3897 family protein [Kribbella catacumbae]|uniref:LppU/SCO3897 family protein n=1 Tax=Kribbella catacumbae TaxID=460086 RepID=UPI00036A3FC3|nr:hypothetical protein [Kribbella catacumbae]